MAIIPREIWLRNRVIEIIQELTSITDKVMEWDAYKARIMNIAEELAYATTEWDKCYKKNC